jgi:hypothetical protein
VDLAPGWTACLSGDRLQRESYGGDWVTTSD